MRFSLAVLSIALARGILVSMGIGAKGIRLFDRFALLAKLAATERGEVWSALDEQCHEVVAVEVFSTSKLRRADDWSRLEHQHELGQRLAHSNVLAIDRPQRDATTVLVVMQLATGGDARRLIGAPYYETLPVLIDIAEALRHAHRQGVAHLDLRPRNVLLDENSCALLKGFRFAGGSQQEFDAAVRKDLRDFSLLGSELLGKTAAAERAAPPRLWALFDRVYDASFGATPMSFAEIRDELEASRHDTAPLALATFDLTRKSRAIDVTPVPPPLELEVESEAETSRLDWAPGPSDSGLSDSGPSESEPDVAFAQPPDDAALVSVEAEMVVAPIVATVVDSADLTPAAAPDAVSETPPPEYLVLPPTANDESSETLDGIEVSLVLEPEPKTRPIAVPLQNATVATGSASSLSGSLAVPRRERRPGATKWRWMAAGFGTLVIAAALWLSREAAIDAEQTQVASVALSVPVATPAVATRLPSPTPVGVSQAADDAAAALTEASEQEQAGLAVVSQLRVAERALAGLDESGARRALQAVQRLDPGNPAVAVGLRRVQAIAGIRPLLADAAQAEEDRDFARAVQGYSQVLTLDRKQRAARDGMDRVRSTIGDTPYGRTLVDAYVALGAGRLEAARDGFGKALITKPDSREADRGLERAEAALTAQRLAPILRRAARYEVAGRWDDALREYDEILATQPDYVLAQQGRQRVIMRVATSGVNVVTGSNGGNLQQ